MLQSVLSKGNNRVLPKGESYSRNLIEASDFFCYTTDRKSYLVYMPKKAFQKISDVLLVIQHHTKQREL